MAKLIKDESGDEQVVVVRTLVYRGRKAWVDKVLNESYVRPFQNVSGTGSGIESSIQEISCVSLVEHGGIFDSHNRYYPNVKEAQSDD